MARNEDMYLKFLGSNTETVEFSIKELKKYSEEYSDAYEKYLDETESKGLLSTIKKFVDGELELDEIDYISGASLVSTWTAFLKSTSNFSTALGGFTIPIGLVSNYYKKELEEAVDEITDIYMLIDSLNYDKHKKYDRVRIKIEYYDYVVDAEGNKQSVPIPRGFKLVGVHERKGWSLDV